jgi:phosphatidylinositol-3,4,5-trisphosphate 3-phosphatase/dual-specificity protein phosphatase PTEN
VHCNHGKGRTGTCIIAYMLFTNQFSSAEKALSYYNKRRFIVDTYGVDQPCQRRYLDYVERVLKCNNI